MDIGARYWDFYDRYVVTVRRHPEYAINRYYAHLIDPFFTKWAHDLGMTPNAVTTLGLIAGLGCGLCLLTGAHITAALLLQLHHLLDGADGNLARLTQRCTPKGARYDQFSDRTVRVVVFSAVALVADVSALWSMAFIGILVADHLVVHYYVLPFMARVELHRARWKNWFLERGIVPGFDHFSLFFLISVFAIAGRLDLLVYVATSLKALDLGYRVWECAKSGPLFEDLPQIQKVAKPVDFWTVEVDYPLSTRLVSLLREGPIDPDHLTYASFASGLLGAMVLLVGESSHATLVAAALLFQCAYILDCADGQLARIRQQYSRHGWRLDLYSDRITETLILISVTAFLARAHPGYWALGMATLGVTTLLQYSRIHELMNAATFSSHSGTRAEVPRASTLRRRVTQFDSLRRKYRLGFLNVGNFYCLNFVFLMLGRADLFLGFLFALAAGATAFQICRSAIKQADADAGFAQVSHEGSKAVLFGAGKGAAQFVSGFKNRGVEIAYVCDNDEQRWGDAFFGAPIVAPIRIAEEADPVTVFIASEWAEEIRPQVRGYGIPDEQIISLY